MIPFLILTSVIYGATQDSFICRYLVKCYCASISSDISCKALGQRVLCNRAHVCPVYVLTLPVFINFSLSRGFLKEKKQEV